MNWYLVRTKAGKEHSVRERLSGIVHEVFFPLLETWSYRGRKGVGSVQPLFPCYLFARFDLLNKYFDVRYLPGVQEIVSAGLDPIAVPPAMLDEIRRRAVDGIVRIELQPLRRGDRVRISEGPFASFEAVFEHYLSGRNRVALLLGGIEASRTRIVMPSSAVRREPALRPIQHGG